MWRAAIALPGAWHLTFRRIIDGITIGIKVLLMFIGALTLGIGGVGVTNIMLVFVDERVREIGLRRALGAKRWHIRTQFLAEALVLTLFGGAIGIVLAWALTGGASTLPMLGPLFQDTSGKATSTWRSRPARSRSRPPSWCW